MTHWLVLAVLVATGCRGKEGGGARAPVGSPSGQGTSAPAKSASWSAMINVGKSTGVLSLASGPIGTFVVAVRHDGAPIVVNGKELVAGSSDEGEAYVQLDDKGAPIWGAVIDGTGQAPAFAIGSSDAVSSIAAVSLAAKGAIATLPNKVMTPVDGNVYALARVAAGTVWVAGRSWGNDDPLAEGKCDRKSFLARRTARGAIEVVDCDSGWTGMQLAAIGDDVVMCASDGNQIGGRPIEGRTFVARIGGDGKLKWLRLIVEAGDARCDDVVVTSDGDVVATGAANENADFTEGAKARGVKVKSSGGYGLDRLWLARFAGDGTRRWARVIARSVVGFRVSLDADRSGNALLAAEVSTHLDLGYGPVGPDGALMVATVDRDAKVNGLLTTSFASSPQAVVDSQNGVVVAIATTKPVTIGGVVLGATGGGETIGVVRVPLPLPPP